MRTELFISWRYLFTRRKEKFISLISIISVAGVAIGVAALIVVTAVMNGFDRDLRDKIVGNYAHLTITGYKNISESDYPELAKKIYRWAHVQGVSPYVQGQALVKEQNRFFAVSLKGIDPVSEAKVSQLSQYLVRGSLNALTPDTIIIGKELALALGLGLNANLTLYSGIGKIYNLKVAGIFNSGMYDYDLNLSFVHLATAQEILGLTGQFSAVAVKLDNLYLAEKLKPELSQDLGFDYEIKTWIEVNRNFFSALKLEKFTMFIILTLIILVAAFNIVSTLVVMVVEKTKDIGILKAIGMNSRSIRRIFIFEGLLIGTSGILSGVSGGLFLCALLAKYQFIRLPQDIYYIDRLPVSLNLWDILWVTLAALAITLLSTIYPAIKASRLLPVEALRYE